MKTITAVKIKNVLIPEDTVRTAVSADSVLAELYYSDGLSNSQRRSIAKTRNVLAKIIESIENDDNTDDPFI
jgi:hypothetical protein